MASVEMWVFGVETGIEAGPPKGINVTGFSVEALDGRIGKVDEATYEENAHGLIVDTGSWILGKKVVLPAGVIDTVDEREERIFLNRSKDQIEESPKFGETDLDQGARGEIGDYYCRQGE